MSSLRSKMKMFVSPIAAFAMVVSGLAVFAAAPASAATRTLTIHYHRTNADYAGWNLWTWNDVVTPDGKNFTGDDTFGKVAVMDVKADGTTVGFLFRSTDNWDTAVKDGGDRSVALNPFGNTEVWFLEGDATVYDYNPLGRAIRIHYKRTAGDYTGWNVWTWGDIDGAGYTSDMRLFTGKDDFGAIATFPVKSAGAGIGFLFRSTDDWATAVKDEAAGNGDRAANLTGATLTEIWMLQGDATVYTTNPDVIVKTDQTIRPFVKKGVKVFKKVTFPMLTTDGTKVKWKSLNPAICVVAGRNYIIGVRPGVCKVEATAPGTAGLNPLSGFFRTITVKA